MATWFVTGANRGLGLGLCQALLARGDRVIGGCRNPEGARELWELASDFKGRFRSVKLDVSDDKSLMQLAQEFADETLDVVVNNAGLFRGRSEGLTQLNFEDLQKSLEINTFGPMKVARALLPALKRGQNPRLISITSLMGSIADNRGGGCYAYRMSKTALNMFHRNFAIEFPGIIGLVLHPGWVQTDMGGSQAPLSVHDSVAGMIHVIDSVTKKNSGEFFDYKGEQLPW